MATVQDEYVLVCQDKHKLAEELEKAKEEMEQKLKEVNLTSPVRPMISPCIC